MATQTKEFRVWVWEKELKKYLLLPCISSTYDMAISYLEKHECDNGGNYPTLDYSKFQIKSRVVTYSDWTVLYG